MSTIRIHLDATFSDRQRSSPEYARAVKEVMDDLEEALADEAVQGARGLADLAMRKVLREAGGAKASLPVASGALRSDYRRSRARGIPYSQRHDVALIVGTLPYSKGIERGWYIEDAFGKGIEVRRTAGRHFRRAARAILRHRSNLNKLAVESVRRVMQRLRKERRRAR